MSSELPSELRSEVQSEPSSTLSIILPPNPAKLVIIPQPIAKRTLLKDVFPEIYAEIHPTINQGIDIEKLTYGSQRKLYWRCLKAKCDHHVWNSDANQRTSKTRQSNTRGHNSSGCPWCAGKVTCPCDSFATKYPDILALFDIEKNPGIDPYSIPPRADQRLNWKCQVAQCDCHRWDSTVYNMTAGFDRSGSPPCPFCSGHKTCPHDSFATKYPGILTLFDIENNPGIDPYSIAARSDQRLNWKCRTAQCDCHQWKAKVDDITTVFNESGNPPCPFCSGHKTCPHDSFATKYPGLLALFDIDKNPGIDPYSIPSRSAQRLNWKCLAVQCDCHRWDAIVSSMTARLDIFGNPPCPFCNGRKICPHNSFKALHPELVNEFVPELNPDLDLDKIAPGSKIEAIWRCFRNVNHANYRASFNSRSNRNSGCPTCRESHLEKAFRYILEKHNIRYNSEVMFPDCRYINPLPFDYQLIMFNILVELDGIQHFEEVYFGRSQHNQQLTLTQQRDSIKTEYTRIKNIHFIRISYSEIANMENHILTFIQDVQSSSVRVERFIGLEYTTSTYENVDETDNEADKEVSDEVDNDVIVEENANEEAGVQDSP
jgi:hypothetical protein